MIRVRSRLFWRRMFSVRLCKGDLNGAFELFDIPLKNVASWSYGTRTSPPGTREFEADAAEGVGFQKPINPYLFVQFGDEGKSCAPRRLSGIPFEKAMF